MPEFGAKCRISHHVSYFVMYRTQDGHRRYPAGDPEVKGLLHLDPKLAPAPAAPYMTTVVISECRAMREVQLWDAKANFLAVVDQAARGETTVVTRHGAPVAVVLGYDEWQRLTHARPGLADLLLSFPEGGEPRRDRTPARDLGL